MSGLPTSGLRASVIPPSGLLASAISASFVPGLANSTTCCPHAGTRNSSKSRAVPLNVFMLLAPVIEDDEVDDELDAPVVLATSDGGVGVDWNRGGEAC